MSKIMDCFNVLLLDFVITCLVDLVGMCDRYVDIGECLYGDYVLIDIIVHDALVICMSRVVHIAFIIYLAWY